ncbi:MAG: transglycosylase SLT domain-containing protein [Proteobacteria bacterium]|nr:transglycosylase SLT domain-containing protein [Pseudomonadota bacterium]
MQTGPFGDIGNATQKTQHLQNVGTDTVVGAIRMASARTGVDFAYLLNKADQESGMNPGAKAHGSSATGLFQFINQTWLKMVKEHGGDYGLSAEADAISLKNGKAQVTDRAVREKILNLRHDPVLNAAMAAEYTRENKDYLDAKLGGNVGSTELYLAHFLGAGGAEKFIKAMRTSPNASAAYVLPDAAEANPAVFYNKSGSARSLQQIYAHFAAKFKNSGTSHFAAAATASDSSTSAPAKRDLAALSSMFYHAPDEVADTMPAPSSMPMLNDWQRAGNTSDTLFNVMILAQSQMKDALSKEKAQTL